MSTFNVNIVHVHTSQSVPVSTPKSPQHAVNSSGAGAPAYVVAPHATSSLNYTSGPWTEILSLNTNVGNATPNVGSPKLIRSSADVPVISGLPRVRDESQDDNDIANESESLTVDRLVVASLATGTVDPAVLIRTSRHSREKSSRGVMRNQTAGVLSNRHHPYNMANRPSRAAVPTNSGNEHANAFCRPSGETENTSMYTSQHRELHHGDGSGYNIPVEQMPRLAPSPNEDGRESEMTGSTGDGDTGEAEQQPRKMQGHRSDYDTCFRSREEICSQDKASVGKRKRRKR
ncbi:hypothetical protein JR316_0012015 [Psilocybe cubensis]|uniref:Uncharacterized protein n=1 Tax=Psilocybe cubensis TaxID=181762 RepID=A0ACB8GL15_PSICU|nr:hypothetical protein JR316_0012015 [Psilocybe cubensis]KAH9476440.1 hypothetical protein JR316_0012015 [Psilocybe cubensis]